MHRTAPHEIWLEGRALSAEDAKGLESSLAENPNDVGARIKLLGYYSIDLRRDSQSERNRHSLWLIAHHPELDLSMFMQIDETLAPEAHAEAIRLWHVALDQQPSNPAVLKAASAFFTFADRAFSKQLLRHGAALEADVASWHDSIGRLCMLDVRPDEPEGVASAREALVEFQKALDLEPSDSKRYGQVRRHLDLRERAASRSHHPRPRRARPR